MKPTLYHCDNISSPTKDIAILSMTPVDPSNILSYRAGQYVEAILHNERRLPLSIANSPQTDGKLLFHIRHNEKHLLAKEWLAELEQTPITSFEGPKGNMTLSRIVPHTKILLLAGGTGYAPIRALLEEYFTNRVHESMPSTLLYWGVTDPHDIYDGDWLKQWEKQLPAFTFETILSDQIHYPSWQGRSGWLHEYCLQTHLNFNDWTVFASGPYEMITACYQAFIKKGLPPTQFISDMM